MKTKEKQRKTKGNKRKHKETKGNTGKQENKGTLTMKCAGTVGGIRWRKL